MYAQEKNQANMGGHAKAPFDAHISRNMIIDGSLFAYLCTIMWVLSNYTSRVQSRDCSVISITTRCKSCFLPLIWADYNRDVLVTHRGRIIIGLECALACADCPFSFTTQAMSTKIQTKIPQFYIYRRNTLEHDYKYFVRTWKAFFVL